MKKRVRRLLRLAAKRWKPSRYRLDLLHRLKSPEPIAWALARRPGVFKDLVAAGMISVTGELAVTTEKGRAFLDRWVVDCPYLVTCINVNLTVDPMDARVA